MKRLVCFILILFMTMSPIAVLAENETAEQWSQGQIKINYAGRMTDINVLKMESGKLYAPLSLLVFCGVDQIHKQEGSLHTYYSCYEEKEKNFARRTFVDTEKRSYAVGLYFTDSQFKKMNVENKSRIYEHYYPLYKGNFTKSVDHAGDIWVPMEELLPLIDAQMQVDEEAGVLVMQPVVNTTFHVLYQYSSQIEDLMFKADDMVGSKFVNASGYVISTVGDLRFDRFDVAFNSGRINDYETIFKDYLIDNEVYLDSFDSSTSIVGAYLGDIEKKAKNTDDASTVLAEGTRTFRSLYQLRTYEIMNRELHWSNINKGIYVLETAATVMEVVSSLAEYGMIYLSQIEDHRLMLEAVYDYQADKAKKAGNDKQHKKITGWPSYKASTNVQKIYNTEAVEGKAIVQEGIRDLSSKLIEEGFKNVTKGTLGPWNVAMDITKAFCKEEYEFIADAGLIEMVDNTVDYAYKAYKDRITDKEFGKDGVNGLRLSLLMTMIGSKHAYKTYWSDKYKQDEIAKINKIMKELYICGMYQDHGNKGTYKTLKKKYSEFYKNLTVTCNTPEILVELAMVDGALKDRADWQNYCSTVMDRDGNGQSDFAFRFDSKVYSSTVACSILYPEDKRLYSEEIPRTRDKTVYMNYDLSSQYVDGIFSENVRSLDAYLSARDGFLFAQDADVNSDGFIDRVYCLYDVMNCWKERIPNTTRELDFYDPYLTVVVAEQKKAGLFLQVDHLTEQKVTAEKLEKIKQHTLISDKELILGAYRYVYNNVAGGYVFAGYDQSALGTITAEQILSGDLTGVEPTWDETGYGYAVVNGEELMMEKNGDSIASLRVTHKEGSMILTGDARSDMTLRQLKEALPGTQYFESGFPTFEWSALTAVYGFEDTPAWYETCFYWAAGDDRIYLVTVCTENQSEDAKVMSVYFVREEAPTWEMIKHLTGAR